MFNNIYIGVDLGTSGCRATAIDDAGNVLEQAAVPIPPAQKEGGAVQQAPALWWESVRETLHTLLKQAPAQAVRAIAVDGTSGTVLLCDRDNQPLSDALMYNDARGVAEAAHIAQHAPAESAAHGVSSGLAKLLWLQARDDTGAYRVASQADWVAAQLTGRPGLSDENNALKLGYDPVLRRWPDWLDALGVHSELLPRVLPPGTAYGPVNEATCREFGLPAGTHVVAGTTDSVAAFIAAGARQPGEAVTSLGSTLALKVISPGPVFAPAFGIYSHRLGELWLAGGASNSGGAVLLDHFSQAEIDAMTPQLDASTTTGLDYYPLRTAGERFPINDPQLAPRLEPRPEAQLLFFQALLEGIANIERLGYQRLAGAGAPYPVSVRTTGGGAHNVAWNEIRARTLGVPVSVAAHEVAAYGAAQLARRGVAGNTDTTEAQS